jgi:hypothetical protein
MGGYAKYILGKKLKVQTADKPGENGFCATKI